MNCTTSPLEYPVILLSIGPRVLLPMSDKNSQTGLSKQLSKEETREALCDTCRGFLIRPHDDIRADV
jgi:hypothetical protein